MSALLIMASGSSIRFGGTENKIFLTLKDLPVFLHSAKTALELPWIKKIGIVHHPETSQEISRHLQNFLKTRSEFAEKFFLTEGGAERNLSVRKGIRCLEESGFEGDIFVHDAARPLADKALFERVREGLKNRPAVFPALPVTETLRKKNGAGFSLEPRELYCRAQTPQAFQAKYRSLFLNDEFLKCRDTDEMACFERNQVPIHMVQGSAFNIKITNPEDLHLVNYYLEQTEK